MRKTLIALLLASLAALPCAAQTAAVDASTMREATAEAERALQSLTRLVTKDNQRQMGFESLEEVRAAKLGLPVHEFFIRLDELQKYEPGQDPAKLLRGTGQVTFPVVVQERTRSSVTLRRLDNRWEAAAFGAPSYTRLLEETRTQLAKGDGRSPAEYFEVKIPALNLSFLGSRAGDGRLLLAPLLDTPRFGFRKGVAQPAEEVLKAVLAAAREHNGLPT